MGGITQMKDNLLYTNEDGELCMNLSALEIEWLDALEQLDEENLAAVFVAWEIESTHRMGLEMVTHKNRTMQEIADELEMKEDG